MDSLRFRTVLARWRGLERPLEIGLPAQVVKRLDALRVDHARALVARVERLDDQYRATSQAAREASRRAS